MSTLLTALDDSNKIGNLSFPVTIPADTAKGSAVVSTSLFQLYGVSSTPTTTIYNLTVTLGDETSTNYISTSDSE